jgi:hypothetical protein
MKFGLRILLGVMAAGAMLEEISLARAGDGPSPPATQLASNKGAPPQRCMRRDTNNDIYYGDCSPISPFAPAPERNLLDRLGSAVQQILQ